MRPIKRRRREAPAPPTYSGSVPTTSSRISPFSKRQECVTSLLVYKVHVLGFPLRQQPCGWLNKKHLATSSCPLTLWTLQSSKDITILWRNKPFSQTTDVRRCNISPFDLHFYAHSTKEKTALKKEQGRKEENANFGAISGSFLGGFGITIFLRSLTAVCTLYCRLDPMGGGLCISLDGVQIFAYSALCLSLFLSLSSHDGFHRRANMSERYAASSVNKTTCTLVRLLSRSAVRKKEPFLIVIHRKKAHVFPRKGGQLSLSHQTKKATANLRTMANIKKVSPLPNLCWRQQKKSAYFFPPRQRWETLFFVVFFRGKEDHERKEKASFSRARQSFPQQSSPFGKKK